MNADKTTEQELTQSLTVLGAALGTRLGERLVMVALYGSAARGLYQPGFSDVNLLLVLTQADVSVLAQVREVMATAGGSWRITPYLVTQQEWPQVLQAFPTRILEMKRGYRVLLGQDLLKDVEVDRQALRVRTQQELLNVLLRFRHALLGSHDPAALEADLRGSLPGFLKVLRTLVYLRTGEHLDERERVVHAGASAYGFSETAFRQLLAWREGQVVLQGTEWEAAAGSFLETLSRVAGGEHG